MAKLKIGVFGAGRGMTMIRQLLGSSEAEVTAVCDKVAPLLSSCKEEAEANGADRVTYYTDFDKFFEHDMDAVVLANYANEHAPYAVKFLKSGRNVMSECLTMANMKEAVDLIEAVEESGKLYCYAENYCYTAARWEMRNIYRSGVLGELQYAEGEYLHDCSPIWHGITYGERNHWRNLMPSTFYCTHSIGPILYMTGLRPVQVSAFETPNMPYMRNLGTASGSAATEIITLENGAILRSLHFNLKSTRESNYQLSCDHGCVQDIGDGQIASYIEVPGENGKGEKKIYKPEPPVVGSEKSGHGGGDFYTTYYFVRAMLDDEVARERTIDVYQAVDMCMPGTLGYRSVVNGNAPVKIPNLRNKAERDPYRNDTFCTFPDKAGDQYVSNQLHSDPNIPDEVFDRVRKMYEDQLAGK